MGAVRDVDRTLVTVARSFGATPLQIYWKVLLPAIVPSVLAGGRLGIGVFLLGGLVGGMVCGVGGGGEGLGSVAAGCPGAGALRGDRARVGGLHHNRAGAR